MHYKFFFLLQVDVILFGTGIHTFYIKLNTATEVAQENTGEINATCNLSLTHVIIKIVFLDSIAICVSSKLGYPHCLL